MPRATFDPNKVQRFELNTLPGAYVVIRRLTMGERASREQLAMQMAVSGAEKNRKVDVQVQVADLLAFDFSVMVTEHNLEDETGRTLNFKNRADVLALDDTIGSEVKQYIDQVSEGTITDEVKN
jgi:hypothetical protein